MATMLRVIKSDGGNAADQPKKTAEQHSAEETVEKLALFKWVYNVAEKVLSEMSEIAEEILDRMKLDDLDDEEEDYVANEQKEREDDLIEKGVADGLKDRPEIAGVEIGHPEIAGIKIEGKYKPKLLAKLVRKAVAEMFKSDPTFSEHIRNEMPGQNLRRYGKFWVSSLGVFAQVEDFEHGGGLTSLFSGGWKRIAKDRIDPAAWSYEFGPERKTETKNWLLHFVVTERNGSQSSLVIPRASLSAENGAPAIRLLMKAGVHLVVTKLARKALAEFLRWKPKAERIRMPQPGWAEVGSHRIYVRSNQTILPPGMSKTKHTYILDDATNPDHYGHQIKGTAAEWGDELAGHLSGNSNVALALGIFFAGPLLYWADEQPGGFHLYGNSGIGKSLVGAIAQSVYGTPYAEGRPYAYGQSWEGTTTGFEYLASLRSDAVHARHMVRAGQHVGECGEHFGFQIGRQLRRMPHRANLALGVSAIALSPFDARERKPADRARRCLADEAPHRGAVAPLPPQPHLRAPA